MTGCKVFDCHCRWEGCKFGARTQASLNAIYIFFFLATSADRFYRIDRSQVSFLESICESEKFPSNSTNLLLFFQQKHWNVYKFWNGIHSLSYELVICLHVFCDLWTQGDMVWPWRWIQKISRLIDVVTSLHSKFSFTLLLLLLPSQTLCLFNFISD